MNYQNSSSIKSILTAMHGVQIQTQNQQQLHYDRIPETNLTDTSLNTVARCHQFSEAFVCYLDNGIEVKAGTKCRVNLSKSDCKTVTDNLSETLDILNRTLGFLCARPEYQKIPSAIRSNNRNIIINANNYTIDELIMLYRLLAKRKVILPNKLRYPADSQSNFKNGLHSLFVDLINMENKTSAYHDRAARQAEDYAFSQMLSTALLTAELVSICLGFVLFFLHACTPLMLAVSGAVFTAAIFSLILLVPVCAGLVQAAHNHFFQNDFNFLALELATFTSAHIFPMTFNPLRGVDYYINLGDHQRVLKKLYQYIEPVLSNTNQISLQTTDKAELREAELGIFEKATNSVVSWFYPAKPIFDEENAFSDSEISLQGWVK